MTTPEPDWNWNGVEDCVFTVEQCNQAEEAFEAALMAAMRAPLDPDAPNRSCMRGPE